MDVCHITATILEATITRTGTLLIWFYALLEPVQWVTPFGHDPVKDGFSFRLNSWQVTNFRMRHAAKPWLTIGICSILVSAIDLGAMKPFSWLSWGCGVHYGVLVLKAWAIRMNLISVRIKREWSLYGYKTISVLKRWKRRYCIEYNSIILELSSKMVSLLSLAASSLVCSCMHFVAYFPLAHADAPHYFPPNPITRRDLTADTVKKELGPLLSNGTLIIGPSNPAFANATLR